MEITVFLLLLAIVAIFLVLRRPKASHVKPVSTRKPYAAVRITPAEHACNAAFESAHRVYLASEAPLLPLQDCSKRESCRCGYSHYDDRRLGSERRGGNVVMRDAYNKKERRTEEKRGRRKDD